MKSWFLVPQVRQFLPYVGENTKDRIEEAIEAFEVCDNLKGMKLLQVLLEELIEDKNLEDGTQVYHLFKEAWHGVRAGVDADILAYAEDLC